MVQLTSVGMKRALIVSSLIEGSRVAVTDGQGRYTVENLPEGVKQAYTAYSVAPRGVQAFTNEGMGMSEGGAQANLVTKHGGSEFHGTAYWYKRHEMTEGDKKSPIITEMRFGFSCASFFVSPTSPAFADE